MHESNTSDDDIDNDTSNMSMIYPTTGAQTVGNDLITNASCCSHESMSDVDLSIHIDRNDKSMINVELSTNVNRSDELVISGVTNVAHNMSIDDNPRCSVLPESSDDTSESSLLSFDAIDELVKNRNAIDKFCESYSLQKVMEKITRDYESKILATKYKAVEYLLDVFGEQVFDEKFLTWLCRKIPARKHRLIKHIRNYQQNRAYSARNSLSNETDALIYNHWLDDENSVISNDSSSDRNKVRISKLKYMVDYKHLEAIADDNITEQDVQLKKTGNIKRYMFAHRRIYTRPLREMHKKFLLKNTDLKCSLSNFIKYKPFYISPPTEREKESCLCKKCQNVHALLKGINTYRKLKRLSAMTSVTEYLDISILKPCHIDNESFASTCVLHPEFFDSKEINFYLFEKKVRKYFKDGVEKSYSHIARVGKKESVKDIVRRLMEEETSYVKHRSHVKNINEVLPLLKATFTGSYVELVFSENLTIKPKFEAQEAHFSGKQYTLHCSIVVDPRRPEEPKYVYHMCDDTTHDPSFVHIVLENIFEERGFRDISVMIKSDNAPNQYKNKYAFKYLQQLADKYNCTIIRIYGAAGHGKGLIDAMSSFGVKSILRRDIIAFDRWFDNSREIVDYLSQRGDSRMECKHVDEKYVDSVRQIRKENSLSRCMVCHIFIYTPGKLDVLKKEYICSCESCLEFKFEDCKFFSLKLEEQHDANDYELDDDYVQIVDADLSLHRFEFVEVPSYVALVSGNQREPLVIVNVTEKGKALGKITDHWNHVIFPGELYLKGYYLVKTRSKSVKRKQFRRLSQAVHVTPDEVFEFSLDIDEELGIDTTLYSTLLNSTLLA